MSLHRRHRKDDNQKAIVAAFEQLGCSVYKLGRPLDLMVCVHGVTWLVDVKSKNGKLTPAQEKFCGYWKGPWSIVRDLDGVKMVVDMARHSRQVVAP